MRARVAFFSTMRKPIEPSRHGILRADTQDDVSFSFFLRSFLMEKTLLNSRPRSIASNRVPVWSTSSRSRTLLARRGLLSVGPINKTAAAPLVHHRKNDKTHALDIGSSTMSQTRNKKQIYRKNVEFKWINHTYEYCNICKCQTKAVCQLFTPKHISITFFKDTYCILRKNTGYILFRKSASWGWLTQQTFWYFGILYRWL